MSKIEELVKMSVSEYAVKYKIQPCAVRKRAIKVLETQQPFNNINSVEMFGKSYVLSVDSKIKFVVLQRKSTEFKNKKK